MATGIIALLSSLVALLFWWLKRRASQRDDPAQQNRGRHEQAESDVARRDGADASRHGLDDLDNLDRLRRTKGPGGK